MATRRRHGALFVENFAQKHRPRARGRRVLGTCAWPQLGLFEDLVYRTYGSYAYVLEERRTARMDATQRHRAPPPFTVPRNSSTPCHRASLVHGDGAIIPRQFFSDPGSLCAASPRNFHLFLCSSLSGRPSHPVPLVRARLLVPLTCSPFRFAASRRTKRKQGEGIAVSVGRRPREGSAIKREEPSNGTISDERSLRVETRGRFPAGGSFFGETEGQRVPGVRHRVVSAFARFFFLLLCN